jgi:PAS domain S-box-containing protein
MIGGVANYINYMLLLLNQFAKFNLAIHPSILPMPRLTNRLSIGKNYMGSPFYIRFGLPVLLLAVVTLMKVLLFKIIGYQIPFILYFGVIVIASRYFGLAATTLIIFLAALTSNYLFIYPFGTFSFGKVASIQTLLFVSECSLIMGLSHALTRAINKVNEADRLFKALIEKSTEVIIMINPDGVSVYCSPAVQDVLGYTPDEFLSFAPWALMHPEETLDIKEEFFRLGGHPGKTISLQHRMKHKNGEWIWIESRTSNLLEEPAVSAIISNFSNITDRILLEKQREDFIGVASHELKTPMTSLKAYTQVLRGRFKDNSADATSYNIAKKIDQQVNRIIRMITALLDVTTLQTGKLNLNKTEFDFNNLVLEITDQLQQTTSRHSITTNLCDTERVNGDKERIAQVVTNFISNAIKYSPDGDSVCVSSELKDGALILSVTDKGIGISPEEQKKVFERFYRVDAAKNTFQGLGLGLYICSQIITLHNGKVGVSSREGEGSTFWFSIPIQ